MTFNHPYCSNGGSGNVIPSVLPALNIVFLFKLSDAISRRDPAEFFRGLPTLASLGDSAMGEGGGESRQQRADYDSIMAKEMAKGYIEQDTR